MTELDARERILDASRAEIAASGVRGLRIQRVAKRAGVSLGLIYYHFEDRAGLLRETLAAVDRAVQERIPEPDPRVPPGELVAAMLEAEFGDEPGTRADSVVWNEIRAIAVFEDEVRTALSDATQDWQSRLTAPLSALGVPDAEIGGTATLLTGLVEGLSSRWLSGQLDTASVQRLMRTGTAAILAGATGGRALVSPGTAPAAGAS
ncbi:TetR/AcrR family transcriptional regulator [Leifsonia shinshuensis]|uniref:AcrR family transcriptional regulator n=1 Tax=Leifsonia shinshuensis TaxID=150026 RepID=A0A853CWY0_9MICO|nr:TetR/AcrR family transcriptional regulator [Leifsonia shinshuensis]NYJ25147.1 AcrR family transcriptional regulator [Leifsonia shinshuensis]